MLPVIEKLLILQDRDRKLLRVKEELSRVAPERSDLQRRQASAQSGLDAAKLKSKQIESDRKKLELDAEALKQKIEKYSVQQFQTKKNDEFKALGHEIDTCKAEIFKLEDQQIELMEKAEIAAREVASATASASEAKKAVENQLSLLAEREENLNKELAELQTNRGELAAAVDDGVRAKYERLLKNKGESVVVGIEHGVCGGCHMRFPTQIILSCKAEQEIVTCPNCGRILYYTRDMDLAVAD
jgi:predicted  nucleic acid-binding Zn-ribbon protein